MTYNLSGFTSCVAEFAWKSGRTSVIHITVEGNMAWKDHHTEMKYREKEKLLQFIHYDEYMNFWSCVSLLCGYYNNNNNTETLNTAAPKLY